MYQLTHKADMFHKNYKLRTYKELYEIFWVKLSFLGHLSPYSQKR